MRYEVNPPQLRPVYRRLIQCSMVLAVASMWTCVTVSAFKLTKKMGSGLPPHEEAPSSPSINGRNQTTFTAFDDLVVSNEPSYTISGSGSLPVNPSPGAAGGTTKGGISFGDPATVQILWQMKADCGGGDAVLSDGDRIGRVTIGPHTTGTCTLEFFQPDSDLWCYAMSISGAQTPRTIWTRHILTLDGVRAGAVYAYVCRTPDP